MCTGSANQVTAFALLAWWAWQFHVHRVSLVKHSNVYELDCYCDLSQCFPIWQTRQCHAQPVFPVLTTPTIWCIWTEYRHCCSSLVCLTLSRRTDQNIKVKVSRSQAKLFLVLSCGLKAIRYYRLQFLQYYLFPEWPCFTEVKVNF